MDSIEKDLEAQIQDSGFSLSDMAPVEFQDTPQESSAPATALEGIEPDFDFLATNEETTEPATEPTATEQVVDEPVQTEEPVRESSLNTETAVEAEEEIDIDGAVLGYLSETLGLQLNSIDDLRSSMTQQQAEIDERVKVIADFVEKTGRSPGDCFR